MTESTTIDTPPSPGVGGLRARFTAFVVDQFPFASTLARAALDSCLAAHSSGGPEALEAVRSRLRDEIARLLVQEEMPEWLETVPGETIAERLAQATSQLAEACDGFLCREQISASLTPDERRELLRGMVLTRAVDNQLKNLFTSGVPYGNKRFQGKGYRSLGQEAIFGACLLLRRGDGWGNAREGWRGDVVAPLIRDLGAVLGMDSGPRMVRSVLNAQVGKAGSPMDGRDFHLGDLNRGVLPPAAPLSIAALNVAGLAYAMRQEGQGRVAVSFIGEGGSSLGEWHEAINVCAVQRLPTVFCIQNNQTALSTPVAEQSAVRAFADKAEGYGIPGLRVDGTDPEAIAVAFGWAADRARAGNGPALIELICMRMCGHAHHDDMLYLGREPEAGWRYPAWQEGGYADPKAYAFWSKRDPIHLYAERLEAGGLIGPNDLAQWKEEAERAVAVETKALGDAPWPEAISVGENVFTNQATVQRPEVLGNRPGAALVAQGLPIVEPAPAFDAKGQTFLEGVMLGVGDALENDPRTFVFGQDVGGDYGNAFLLLRPLLERFGARIVNAPLAEGSILGVCVGAALGGLRPIGEIQFNDFVATGFNQLVNNAAKIRYRWGASVPMVLRMPSGGLRSAGPYHSQNTEAWFYRTPGLKIVVPSTPADARALFAAAVADPDPVLFYEHIALYREPSIKQRLDDEAPTPLPLGRAALRRSGDDIAIVSYGAYVHRALTVAERLAQDGIEASVLDLRSLVPLDRETLLRVAGHCGRILVVHEDSRRGSIGESVAAIIQEEVFEYLDAPVRVLGALDTPVPYAPSLEEAFLVSNDEIEHAARLLVAY